MASNYKKSPVIGDNGISASPQEISILTHNALETFKLSVTNNVDLHDAKSVYNTIVQYFQQCENNHVRPGNLGLYAALGMSKQDYNNVVTGKSKSKASLDCIDLMKKAVRAIGAYREGLALEGKINPVTYIFMGKNYDGLSDVQQLEVTAKPAQDPTLTPDEIQQQLEKDIPIDIE
jgi:hypothetical protein